MYKTHRLERICFLSVIKPSIYIIILVLYLLYIIHIIYNSMDKTRLSIVKRDRFRTSRCAHVLISIPMNVRSSLFLYVVIMYETVILFYGLLGTWTPAELQKWISYQFYLLKKSFFSLFSFMKCKDFIAYLVFH